MARRRRRRKNDGAALVLGVLLLGGAAVTGLPGLTRELVARHRDTLIVAGAAVVAVTAVLIALVLRSRWRAAARQAERDRYISTTDNMSGPEFEHYVARLMRRDGLKRVGVCGQSGDLGADIIGYLPDGRKVVVQCKRYAGSVGDPHMQKFNGTAWQIHHADVALFVTTGRPTIQARNLARRCGITLLGRNELAAWAIGDETPFDVKPYDVMSKRRQRVATNGTDDVLAGAVFDAIKANEARPRAGRDGG